MPFDLHKDYARSTVATAPSPATTGTTLSVFSGDGGLFPTPPFNAVIWPNATRPTAGNAEIVRVLAMSGDNITNMTRKQSTADFEPGGPSSAISIAVGMNIAAAITARSLIDIERPLRTTRRIGSMTFIGHSYIAGTSQSDSGLSNVYQESLGSRVQSLLQIHDDNVLNLAMGSSSIMGFHPAQFYAGWKGVAQFVLPSNSIPINAAADVVVTDPNVAVGGAGMIIHGCNDYAKGIDGTALADPLRYTRNAAAAKHAYRFIISRMRSGTVYCSYAVGLTGTWDSSIAFTTGAWTNGLFIANSCTGAYFKLLTNFTTGVITITLPVNFTGGTVCVNLIGQPKGVTAITSAIASSGDCQIANPDSTFGTKDFPTTGTLVVKIDSEEMLVAGDSGTANAAVTSTNTTLRDTRRTWTTNAMVGVVVTCNGKTMTVTSNTGDTLTGASWSGGGNPGNGNAWSIPSGLGTGSWLVIAANRAVNGTALAAHSSGAACVTADDTVSVAWTGTVFSAGSNPSHPATPVSGQGGWAQTLTPVTVRFACTGADAGKTIIATFTNAVAGDTSYTARFDSWSVESPNPNPVVISNLHHYEYSGPTLFAHISTIAAIAATWNPMITAIAAEYADGFVGIADVYTPFYNRNGTLTANINNSVTSCTWQANDPTYTPAVGLAMTFGMIESGFVYGETVIVTSVSASGGGLFTLGISRAQKGTAATSHLSGDALCSADWMHTDNLHLNPLGHAVYAERVSQALDAMPAPSEYQMASVQGAWGENARNWSIGVVDAQYLYTPLVGTPTTGTPANLQHVAVPIWIPRMCTMTGMGVEITTGAAGTIRFGIYMNGNGKPGFLLQDFGTMANSGVSTAAGLAAILQVLRPGWYWLSMVQETAAATLRTYPVGGLPFPSIMPTAQIGAVTPLGISRTHAGGAMPNSFSSPVVETASGNVPRFWVYLRTGQFG